MQMTDPICNDSRAGTEGGSESVARPFVANAYAKKAVDACWTRPTDPNAHAAHGHMFDTCRIHMRRMSSA